LADFWYGGSFLLELGVKIGDSCTWSAAVANLAVLPLGRTKRLLLFDISIRPSNLS